MNLTVEELSKKITEVLTDIKNGIDVESNEEILNELMNKCIEMQQDNEEKLSTTPTEEVVDIEIESLKSQIEDLESKIEKIDKIARFATRDTLSKREEYVKELEGLKTQLDEKKIDANGKNEEIIRENEKLSKLIVEINDCLNFKGATFEPENGNVNNELEDELFDRKTIEDVLRFAITKNDGKITPSMVQRYCKFGYARAAMLVDKLYEMGLVSDTFGTSSLRKVSIKLEQLDDFLKNYNHANTKTDGDNSATVVPNANIIEQRFTDKEWEQLIKKATTYFHNYGFVYAHSAFDGLFGLSKDETKELINCLVKRGIISLDDSHQIPYYHFILPDEEYNNMFVVVDSNEKDSVQHGGDEGINDAYIDELSEMLKQSPLYNENNKVFINKTDVMNQFATSSNIEPIEPVSNKQQPIILDDLSAEDVQQIKKAAAQASIPTMDDIVFPTSAQNNNAAQPSSIIMDDIVPMQQPDSITRYAPITNDNDRKKISRKKKRNVPGSKKQSIVQKMVKSIGEYFFGDEEYRDEQRRKKEQNIQDLFADDGYRTLIDSEEEQRIRRR